MYAKALIESGDPIDASEVLLQRLPAPEEPIETRRSMYFVLGKAMEKAGEFQSAFEAYAQGNALSAQGFDRELHSNQIDDIIDTFPADSFDSMPSSTLDCPQLVFVVGMLRSGSTLTEQIIDAHPRGKGLGEIEVLPSIINKALAGNTLSTFLVNDEHRATHRTCSAIYSNTRSQIQQKKFSSTNNLAISCM